MRTKTAIDFIEISLFKILIIIRLCLADGYKFVSSQTHRLARLLLPLLMKSENTEQEEQLGLLSQ